MAADLLQTVHAARSARYASRATPARSSTPTPTPSPSGWTVNFRTVMNYIKVKQNELEEAMDEGDDERCKVLTDAIANLRRQAAEVRTHATVVTEASRYARSVAVAEARLAEKKKRSQRVMTSAKYAVCHIVPSCAQHESMHRHGSVALRRAGRRPCVTQRSARRRQRRRGRCGRDLRAQARPAARWSTVRWSSVNTTRSFF